MVLLSLIGDQPVPNLLPARRIRPRVAVLVHTERTRGRAVNLSTVLEREFPCRLCEVDAYNIPQIRDSIQTFVARQYGSEPVVYNLTGGTKPMALAAFQLACRSSSPFVYFRTEGRRSCLYRYAIDDGHVRLETTEELEDTICLDDYLRVYVGGYEAGAPRNAFEEQVVSALRATPGISKVLASVRPAGLGALEIDFVVRCGNQVGVGEVKSKGAKAGIDQINAVAHPRYLGTYVGKFLVSGYPVHRNNLDLAQAYRIEVIELPSIQEGETLDSADREKLSRAVLRRLGGAP